MSVMDTDENLQALADVALRKGAQPYAAGQDVVYDVGDAYLSPDADNYVISIGGKVDNYHITRYKAVSKLSTNLPASLPGSTTEDEDGKKTPVKWQDVQNLATVNISPVSGTHYFNVTAHLSHRGLTLDEYNTIIKAGVKIIETPPVAKTDEIE